MSNNGGIFQLWYEPCDEKVVDSSNVQQKIISLLETVKQERLKFYSYYVLCEVISDSIKHNSIRENVKQKIEKLVLTVKVKTCLEIQTSATCASRTSRLLGLLHIPSLELTSEERYELKNVVQQTLSKKLSSLTCNLEKVTSLHCDSTTSHLKLPICLSSSLSLKKMFEQKFKLNKQKEIYYKNITEYYEILEQFVNLRVNNFPKLCQEKLQEYDCLSKMYGLRAQVLNSKANLGIFAETKSSLISYKGIIKKVKEEQKKSRYEILQLEELKEQYAQVSNKQFHEIVISYKQYKTSYDKIKKVHEKLNLS